MHTCYKQSEGTPHSEIGAMIAKYLGKPEADPPSFVRTGSTGNAGAGYLGPRYQPFTLDLAGRLCYFTAPYTTPEGERRRNDLLRFVEEKFGHDHKAEPFESHRLAKERSWRLQKAPLVFDSGRHTGMKLWDATTGKVQRDLSAAFKETWIATAAYSPDGKLLALGRGGETELGKVYLLDPATGKMLRELAAEQLNGITDLAFHPDGKHLASTGRDRLVRIWNIAEGKLVKELGKPRGGQFKDWFHSLSFSADGRWLAAGDMAGAVQVWSLTG
jgi:hypothetical protein